MDLSAWVLSLLLHQLPPERAASAPCYVEACETPEERTARYASIAEDIASVAHRAAPSERAQRRAAALLVGVAILESGLAKDVDMGPCAPARVARGGCDNGRARSLWQIQGLSAQPSRREAAEIALGLMRRSFIACRHLPELERLSVYASGSCASAAGRRASRVRVDFARRLEAR